MLRSKSFVNQVLLVFFSAALLSPVRGEAAANTRPTQLLGLALRSAEGHKLKRSALTEVLYRPGKAERLYLVTKSGTLYAFYVRNAAVIMQWQGHLVPSGSRHALAPSGPLGYYFQRQNKRIANTALGPERIQSVSFLNDLDDPIPITAYKVLKDGTLVAAAAARALGEPE